MEDKIKGGNILIEDKESCKKVRKHVAVDHLNFTVEKGKIYGFLGQMAPESPLL